MELAGGFGEQNQLFVGGDRVAKNKGCAKTASAKSTENVCAGIHGEYGANTSDQPWIGKTRC